MQNTDESNQAEIVAAWLAAIVESSDDAIIGKDLNSIITSWNQGAEKIFGYTAAEIVGTSIMRLIPLDRQGEESQILAQLRRGDRLEHFETWRQTKEGRLIEVSVTASPIKDRAGRVIGASKIARDITVLKEREREIARLSRLYAALSQVNQAIVWMPNRQDLFQKICQVLVEYGGFDMAWIGWHDAEKHQLHPVAAWGDKNAYLQNIKIYTDDRPEGHSPTATAYRQDRPYVCNDLFNDPVTLPWRTEIRQRGWRASADFPIRMKGAVCGTLTVCANEVGFFRDKEMALLVEAAGDISFGLDNLARNEESQQAEQKLRQERDFSETVINSLPGVFYLYDQNGKFLRWNKNFEQVTGYTADEIATMHPLDFFAGAEKVRLAATINEVFEQGQSAVEAGLVSKDGRLTPYYFTGITTELDGQVCLVGVGMDITERKRAEEQRWASEARHRALFDYAPDGILIGDAESYYLDANAAMCRMVGYTHDELVGPHASDIIAPVEFSLIASTLRAINAHRDHHGEYHLQRKEGSIFPVEIFATRMPDGNIVAMIRDITERKQAETRVAESERKYRELVELANSIILRWNSKGHITFLNEFGQQYFGYTVEEIFGRPVIGTIVPTIDITGQDLQALMDQIRLNPDSFEKNVNENMRRNGERVWISWTNRIVRDEQDQVVEILSVGTDVTEQRRAERALYDLNVTLEQKVIERTVEVQAALVRAEAADQLKSAFLATMSHELRTPLNSIIGFTGILLQGLAGSLNAEQIKQLGMVRNSARHLLALINDVLDISKIEAGQLEVHAEPFDLPASIGRVTALVKPLAEHKGLSLTLAVSSDIGTMVSDQRRVEQILLNLLNNAIKFTEQGHVLLEAELLAAFHFSAESAPQLAVRLRVTDTGIGIQPKDLGKLFQPFRQIDSGMTRQHDGTGLGLSICRKLATLLGGDISATSQWAQGSTFTVTLPLQRSVAP